MLPMKTTRLPQTRHYLEPKTFSTCFYPYTLYGSIKRIRSKLEETLSNSTIVKSFKNHTTLASHIRRYYVLVKTRHCGNSILENFIRFQRGGRGAELREGLRV
jgi:hypothetical protein